MKSDSEKRIAYENTKNKFLGRGRYLYSPAPSAPYFGMKIKKDKIELSHNPRPPSSPPPPPPVCTSDYADPSELTYKRLCFGKSSSRGNKEMFVVALVQAFLAAIILVSGIWCCYESTEYCPYYSAIWTSLAYLVTAFIGCLAARRNTINFYVSYLVLSLISMMICGVGALLSTRNWMLIGTYQHPIVDRNHAFCLLGERDIPRLSYIIQHLNQYDFRSCLFKLKFGIAVNSLQLMVTVIEALLYLISAILCCKRTCTKCINRTNS